MIQFSKIGNSWEQLFHAWRFFHFDENTETIDAYVQRIRQVAACLTIVNHKFWKCSKTLCPHVCIGYYSQMKPETGSGTRILTK